MNTHKLQRLYGKVSVTDVCMESVDRVSGSWLLCRVWCKTSQGRFFWMRRAQEKSDQCEHVYVNGT